MARLPHPHGKPSANPYNTQTLRAWFVKEPSRKMQLQSHCGKPAAFYRFAIGYLPSHSIAKIYQKSLL
jgi:hypothetical protein